ncbi:MAG: hypothetical protein PHO20_00165 [Candidatus Peribacteraceae bacterium]|nr:hypothetical protein [Candidatus Peribacteraceae bacterium]MDD5739171.1 hypothetical protein [Candidatus Peribacteraceae bacterium]
MDLRSLPAGLNPEEHCRERRARVENETVTDLSLLHTDAGRIGQADEKNCEQMIGSVPLPVGIAGPLAITFSSGEKSNVFLPLATTEAALVASVNRGCKVLSTSGGVSIKSVYHGMSRSLVFKPKNKKGQTFTSAIKTLEQEWKRIGEATSAHLKILRYDLDESDGYTFLTIFCDTSEAMGMNMTTIAAQAIGNFLAQELDADLITIAANVDSDKKPSSRTHDRGRGYEVTAKADIPSSIIANVLKTTPQQLCAVADAKLRVGSALAGAIGSNLHVANVIAALYLATGQDGAHVVEGSLADTKIVPLWTSPPPPSPPPVGEERPLIPLPPPGEGLGMGKKLAGIRIEVRLPALLVGVRGGGTALPAQNQCLSLILKPQRGMLPALRRPQQLAETIGAAVLAGELSLLAAQATQTLASSHKKLAR